MILMLDTADEEVVKKMIDLYPIDGVTTNPSIVGAMKRPLKDLITDLNQVIGDDRMLHVQTLSENADDIVRVLKDLGLNITATAIFTQQQGLVAAKGRCRFF